MNRILLIAVGLGLVALLVVVFVIAPPKQGTVEVHEVKEIKKVEELSPAAALYNTAASLQSQGKLEEAVKLYQDLVKQFPQDQQSADAWYKLGQIYEKQNLWQGARDAYSKVIADFPNFAQIAAIENKLWELNVRLLFSPVASDRDVVYKVKPGDTLGRIAANHHTTVALIMRSNELESDLIRPGQRLKISSNSYSVIVDKSQNSLTLKADDEVFKVYTVATGRYNRTPTGTFEIVEKLVNPDWYKKGAGPIPADSPENVLGSRWLGLSEPKYGIHGGASEEDLGNQVTDGCIRMTNSEVEELFTILPRGTKVRIVD